MDWQTPEDTVPADIVTDALTRQMTGKPPASGAWRDGDPVGARLFAPLGDLRTESGAVLPRARLAYETVGTLDADRGNAVLVLHGLTGDGHLTGEAGPGHPTDGWWSDLVGPGLALDTDRWFVVSPNILGGCQGTTGPASLSPDGVEWGARFPYLTVRDQAETSALLADALGVPRWAAVIGGSMGGMQALEFGLLHGDRVDRLGIIAAPPATTADQIAVNLVQLEAILGDTGFVDGEYYDRPPGDGPHRGLALARRMALLNYRSPDELNKRFARSWQSGISPLGAGGRFAVESYLDFHGNKFTRRYDANSYITLVQAMNSHDIGRDRGGPASALAALRPLTLVLGIDSDRLFPVDGQRAIAAGIPSSLSGSGPVVVHSEYGHDGFLIEAAAVGGALAELLNAAPVAGGSVPPRARP